MSSERKPYSISRIENTLIYGQVSLGGYLFGRFTQTGDTNELLIAAVLLASGLGYQKYANARNQLMNRIEGLEAASTSGTIEPVPIERPLRQSLTSQLAQGTTVRGSFTDNSTPIES